MQHTAEVRELPAQGAHPNFRFFLWNAPVLATAAILGNTATVEVLLAAGADVNATTDKGQTSLWAATQAGKTDVALLLPKAGARR